VHNPVREPPQILTCESLLAAFIAIGLDVAHNAANISADSFPIPEVASALRRTPDELRLAALSVIDVTSWPALSEYWRAAGADSVRGGHEYEKLIGAARAAGLSDDMLPDFMTELDVGRSRAASQLAFSHLPLLRSTVEFPEFEDLPHARAERDDKGNQASGSASWHHQPIPYSALRAARGQERLPGRGWWSIRCGAHPPTAVLPTGGEGGDDAGMAIA